MDPRATITPVGLTQQFALATRLADMMNRSLAAIARTPAASATPPAPDLRAQLVTLNADLATAYDVVEGADRAPTTQAARAVSALEGRLSRLIGQTPAAR